MQWWRKTYLTAGGGLLVIGGLIMLVTPGPGIIAILLGLALWAKEYTWAKRLLRWAKRKFSKK